MPTSKLRIDIVEWAFLLLAVCTPFLRGEIASLPKGVNVVQADPHSPGTLLAGTVTAQLFRSRDGAETWSQLPFPGTRRCTLHAMVIDPTKPDVYLVAVSSERPEYAGVFRTVDSGETWYPLRGMEQKQV